jgi:hypothetical protein
MRNRPVKPFAALTGASCGAGEVSIRTGSRIARLPSGVAERFERREPG